MPDKMTVKDWIMINQDITECIQYARYRLGDKDNRDIWQQIERTNQNLQVVVNSIINSKL